MSTPADKSTKAAYALLHFRSIARSLHGVQITLDFFSKQPEVLQAVEEKAKEGITISLDENLQEQIREATQLELVLLRKRCEELTARNKSLETTLSQSGLLAPLRIPS